MCSYTPRDIPPGRKKTSPWCGSENYYERYSVNVFVVSHEANHPSRRAGKSRKCRNFRREGIRSWSFSFGNSALVTCAPCMYIAAPDEMLYLYMLSIVVVARRMEVSQGRVDTRRIRKLFPRELLRFSDISTVGTWCSKFRVGFRMVSHECHSLPVGKVSSRVHPLLYTIDSHPLLL